jgi:hypothetical protein
MGLMLEVVGHTDQSLSVILLLALVACLLKAPGR